MFKQASKDETSYHSYQSFKFPSNNIIKFFLKTKKFLIITEIRKLNPEPYLNKKKIKQIVVNIELNF